MAKHRIVVKKVHTLVGQKWQAIPLENGYLSAFGDTKEQALEAAKDNLRYQQDKESKYYDVEL